MLAAAGSAGRQRDDHVGPDHPDQPHVVGDDLVLPPLLERLFDAEREAEVDGSREVLLGAVEAVERVELLRPQHAERLEQLGSDFILPAVAARRRRQRGAISLTAIQQHQQRVVLVVGMRGRVQEDAGVRQMTKREAERDVPTHFVERHDAKLCVSNGEEGGKYAASRDEGASHATDLTGTCTHREPFSRSARLSAGRHVAATTLA